MRQAQDNGQERIETTNKERKHYMKSIEPEDLVYITDEIDRHSNFNHEQLEILMGVLRKLEEEYQICGIDLQFLADSFQSMADQMDDSDEVDYLPALRSALGSKYMKAVGRG
jgi:thymidine kinase